MYAVRYEYNMTMFGILKKNEFKPFNLKYIFFVRIINQNSSGHIYLILFL